MTFIQKYHQAIDISNWQRDEEFAEYPEGARDKTLLYSPADTTYPFLKNGHRYFFKRSSPRGAEQYWLEILAYCLGREMSIPVPPAYVAYDSNQNQSGALIEWFLKQIPLSGYEMSPIRPVINEIHRLGGDYCQQYLPEFDRKKGKQHNFETIKQIFCDLEASHPHCNTDWKNYWGMAFAFDALIGNTDRHQDNWGIIATPAVTILAEEKIRISPIFDNGTSMGYEISSNKFKDYENETRLENYVSKGRHHMKWRLSDRTSLNHTEMLKTFTEEYPETKPIILNNLRKINNGKFRDMLDELTSFDVPVRLSADRASFMLTLLQFRYRKLLELLEK